MVSSYSVGEIVSSYAAKDSRTLCFDLAHACGTFFQYSSAERAAHACGLVAFAVRSARIDGLSGFFVSQPAEPDVNDECVRLGWYVRSGALFVVRTTPKTTLKTTLKNYTNNHIRHVRFSCGFRAHDKKGTSSVVWLW